VGGGSGVGVEADGLLTTAGELAATGETAGDTAGETDTTGETDTAGESEAAGEADTAGETAGAGEVFGTAATGAVVGVGAADWLPPLHPASSADPSAPMSTTVRFMARPIATYVPASTNRPPARRLTRPLREPEPRPRARRAAANLENELEAR
jgi:hypothetical protein